MPFQYSDIEDEIVEQLKTVITGTSYTVMPLPDKQVDFQRLVTPNSALFIVAYSDSAFDPPAALDIIKQNENVTILVNIRAARRKGDYSINQGMQIVKQVLQGYKPQNCGQLYLQKIEFDDRNEVQNYFSYNITFITKKIHMQAQDFAEELGPLLKSLTWRSQFAGDFTAAEFAPADFNTNIHNS